MYQHEQAYCIQALFKQIKTREIEGARRKPSMRTTEEVGVHW
jgi:hypothetical protein